MIPPLTKEEDLVLRGASGAWGGELGERSRGRTRVTDLTCMAPRFLGQEITPAIMMSDNRNSGNRNTPQRGQKGRGSRPRGKGKGKGKAGQWEYADQASSSRIIWDRSGKGDVSAGEVAINGGCVSPGSACVGTGFLQGSPSAGSVRPCGVGNRTQHGGSPASSGPEPPGGSRLVLIPFGGPMGPSGVGSKSPPPPPPPPASLVASAQRDPHWGTCFTTPTPCWPDWPLDPQTWERRRVKPPAFSAFGSLDSLLSAHRGYLALLTQQHARYLARVRDASACTVLWLECDDPRPPFVTDPLDEPEGDVPPCPVFEEGASAEEAALLAEEIDLWVQGMVEVESYTQSLLVQQLQTEVVEGLVSMSLYLARPLPEQGPLDQGCLGFIARSEADILELTLSVAMDEYRPWRHDPVGSHDMMYWDDLPADGCFGPYQREPPHTHVTLSFANLHCLPLPPPTLERSACLDMSPTADLLNCRASTREVLSSVAEWFYLDDSPDVELLFGIALRSAPDPNAYVIPNFPGAESPIRPAQVLLGDIVLFGVLLLQTARYFYLRNLTCGSLAVVWLIQSQSTLLALSYPGPGSLGSSTPVGPPPQVVRLLRCVRIAKGFVPPPQLPHPIRYNPIGATSHVPDGLSDNAMIKHWTIGPIDAARILVRKAFSVTDSIEMLEFSERHVSEGMVVRLGTLLYSRDSAAQGRDLSDWRLTVDRHYKQNFVRSVSVKAGLFRENYEFGIRYLGTFQFPNGCYQISQVVRRPSDGRLQLPLIDTHFGGQLVKVHFRYADNAMPWAQFAQMMPTPVAAVQVATAMLPMHVSADLVGPMRAGLQQTLATGATTTDAHQVMRAVGQYRVSVGTRADAHHEYVSAYIGLDVGQSV